MWALFNSFFVFLSCNKKTIQEMNKAKETIQEEGLFGSSSLSKRVIISQNVTMST
jgi:hypothetical protein